MTISMSVTAYLSSISRTTSSICWRTSGVCIGGRGMLRSSIAIVTFMPGRRRAYSGAAPPSGWFTAYRMAAFTSASGSIGCLG